AEYMCVDRHGGLAESGVEHDICGLASNTRQFLECLAMARYLAAVALDQELAGSENIACLGVVQPDGADVAFDAGQSKFDHGSRRRGNVEQTTRGEAHALVGGLRGEDHGDQ